MSPFCVVVVAHCSFFSFPGVTDECYLRLLDLIGLPGLLILFSPGHFTLSKVSSDPALIDGPVT